MLFYLKRLGCILTLVFGTVFTLNIAIADYLTTTGERINFENLKNKKQWVIVHYWASWCSVCLEELPIYNELAALKNPNLRILGVHVGSGSGPVARDQYDRLKAKHGLMFPQFIQDPANYLGIKKVEYVPMTVIIDPNGKIERIKTGPLTKQAILKMIS